MSVKEKLQNLGLRVEIDDRNEKIGYKMRESQMRKIPHTLVIGDNEIQNNSINYRLYSETNTKEMKLDEYVSYILDLIKNKK